MVFSNYKILKAVISFFLISYWSIFYVKYIAIREKGRGPIYYGIVIEEKLIDILDVTKNHLIFFTNMDYDLYINTFKHLNIMINNYIKTLEYNKDIKNILIINKNKEPNIFKQAMDSNEKNKWYKAYLKENNKLLK